MREREREFSIGGRDFRVPQMSGGEGGGQCLATQSTIYEVVTPTPRHDPPDTSLYPTTTFKGMVLAGFFRLKTL